jgi:hypothetical protein
MPGNRQQGSDHDLRQKKLDDMRQKIAKAKIQVDVFISLIMQYCPEKDARKVTSLTKINHQIAQFDELQVSSVKADEEQLKADEEQLKLKSAEKQLHYASQFDVIHKLIGSWNEVLLNMKDLLNQSTLNNYTKESPGKKETIGTVKGITDYDKKNCATTALEIAEKNIKQIEDSMNKLKEEQYKKISLTAVKPDHDEFAILSSEDIDKTQQCFDRFALASLRQLPNDFSKRVNRLCKKLQPDLELSLSDGGRELWARLRAIHHKAYRHQLNIETLSPESLRALEKQIRIINTAVKDSPELKEIVSFADKVSKIACLSEKAYEAGKRNRSEVQRGLLINIVDEASSLGQFRTTFADFVKNAKTPDKEVHEIERDFLEAGDAIVTMKSRGVHKLMEREAQAQKNSRMIERFLLYTDKLISSRFRKGKVQLTPAYFVGHKLIKNDNDLTILASRKNDNEFLRANDKDTWDFLLAIKLYEQWKYYEELKHNGKIPPYNEVSDFDEEIERLTQEKSSSREKQLKRLSASQLLTENQRAQMEKFSQGLKSTESKGKFSKEAKAVVKLAEIFAKIYVAHEAYLNADDKHEKSLAKGSPPPVLDESEERSTVVALEQFKQHQQVMEILNNHHRDIYMTLDSVAALHSLDRDSAQKGQEYTSFPRDPANESEFFVRQGLNTALVDLLIQALPDDISDENRRAAKPQEEPSIPMSAHLATEVKESSPLSPVDSSVPPVPSREPPKPPLSEEALTSADSKPPAVPFAPKPTPYKSRSVDESKISLLPPGDLKSPSSAPASEQKEEITIVTVKSKSWWQSVVGKLWGASDDENQPLLSSMQQEEKVDLAPDKSDEKSDYEPLSQSLPQDEKELDEWVSAVLLKSFPPLNDKKTDTWVSAALRDASLSHESKQQRSPDSWSLQLRNGFIEVVSPKDVGKSFAGTNQQCVIALAGSKISPEIVAKIKKVQTGGSKGGQAQSQYYNSACTADLEDRLTSIARATESLVPVAQEKLQSLHESYLNEIRQLNLEELFEQLDKEEVSGKTKRFSPKDWITKSLFTGAKGWSAFYKEYQRQHPVLPNHKKIAKRIKQAADIMANYLQEAQEIAAQENQPFKIKDVAKAESRLIGDNGRSTFISLFDYAGHTFADCQMPIGKSTVPSSDRGLTEHKGYANFVKTCLYRYERGDSKLLFQGYRHSAAPPIDLKDKKIKIEKTLANIKIGLAQQFADTLQQRIDSRELDPQKHMDKASALSMSVASLSLLTPEHGFLKPFHDKGSNNEQLTMIDNAFAQIDGEPLEVTLKEGGTIYVRPDICLMNAPTNHAGNIHYYSPEDFKDINRNGFAKLIIRIQNHLRNEKFPDDNVKEIMVNFNDLLDAMPAERQLSINSVNEAINKFWEDGASKTDLAKEQCNFLQLAVEIIEIYSRGLRENALNMLEFQSCFMMLNYMMGGIVEMYCKSGKDRTGAIDENIKAKYLALSLKDSNGRFPCYRPLIERAKDKQQSAIFNFIKGPLATIQQRGASPFAAGENAYGARNLQRNKFLAGFASGKQTQIDLALAKLNKKPFSQVNKQIWKKIGMGLAGVVLLAPALLYSIVKLLNHHIIQPVVRFSRANNNEESLIELANKFTKVPSQKEHVSAGIENSQKQFSSNAASAHRTIAGHGDTLLAAAAKKEEQHVGQLDMTTSSSNVEVGKSMAEIILVPDTVVEASGFIDTRQDGQQSSSTGVDESYYQKLVGICEDINRHFVPSSSNDEVGSVVTASHGRVLIAGLFKKIKNFDGDNDYDYDKAQKSLIDLLVLSLPNNGIKPNEQGAYCLQQPDGTFVPPTLQLTIGRKFDDNITLRNVLAIMLKVRELLERHNESFDLKIPVELEVIVQKEGDKSERLYFSDEDGCQKIKKLAPKRLGSLTAKANALEDQIRKSFDKFNLELTGELINRGLQVESQKPLLS